MQHRVVESSASVNMAMAAAVGGEEGKAMERCRVVVVGGGLAGLAAAKMLAEECGDDEVVVLEAASSLGGRIKHVTGLVPWPVEVGPEFFHGTKNSSIQKIAEKMGCHMRELPYHRYYLGHERRMLSNSEAEENKDIQLVHKLFQGIAAENRDAPDISMAEYLRDQGANHTITQLAQSEVEQCFWARRAAVYANDFGCSLEQLGVRECIQEAEHWIYGDTYLILDRPLSSIIDNLAQGLKVRLDWPVQTVEYNAQGVKLLSCNGRSVMADYVILTVPVSILQHGVITFAPPLPQSKLKAIDSIGMNNCVKVLLAFSERFWPEDFFDVVCTDCFLPEIWVTQYPPSLNHANGRPPLGQFVVVGFLAGELAVAAARLPEAEIIRRSLSQLDDMFGSSTGNTTEIGSGLCHAQGLKSVDEALVASEKPHKFLTRDDFQYLYDGPQSATLRPATSLFRGGYVVNWEEESFVRGGYTHPSINAHGARAILAMPLLERVFFAGEATHPGVNPCMQAAIDTGRRAASEILSLKVSSRL